MKRTKDYLMKIIKKYKMIVGDTTSLPNGNTRVSIELSHEEEYGGRMTINDLAQEMREGFKQVNKRLDVIETRLDVIENDIILIKEDISILKKEVAEHSDILKRNNLK